MADGRNSLEVLIHSSCYWHSQLWIRWPREQMETPRLLKGAVWGRVLRTGKEWWPHNACATGTLAFLMELRGWDGSWILWVRYWIHCPWEWVCSPGADADRFAKAIPGINWGYLGASIQQSWPHFSLRSCEPLPIYINTAYLYKRLPTYIKTSISQIIFASASVKAFSPSSPPEDLSF